MERCVLLHARRYDFKDRESGRPVRGVTLIYLTDHVDQDADQLGSMPLNIKAPIEVWRDLGPVPGVYDIDFRQRPGPGGKPVLQAARLQFVGAVSLDSVVADPVQ